MMMRWFGEDWGAPMCKDCPHVETPVGEYCGHCLEPIAEGDCGVLLPSPFLPHPSEAVPFHYECNLRQVIGSQGHQTEQCSCYGVEDTSELGLTPRQAAVKATLWFEAARGKT